MSDFFTDPSGDTPLRTQFSKETRGDTARESPPWKSGDQFGGFELLQLLGQGSSGFVYRVRERETGRVMALKILRQGDADVLMRNRIGFRRMMPIEHPNLVRVDRIYQIETYTALGMEEVDGVTLGQAVRDLSKLSEQDAFGRLLVWLRDFATGLAVIHAHGLVHRDIKPQNLMIDTQGRGRVIDYGLVEAFAVEDKDMLPGGFILGTTRYLSPEALWSQRYLPAGDIFGLGIVMLESLTAISQGNDAGRTAETVIPRDKMSRVDAELISESLDELPGSVPNMIRDACREMLERHPSDRPTAMSMSRLGLPPQAMAPFHCAEPMIGRDTEWAQATAWVDGVFEGNVGRLNVVGPSGIGKTRLLEELIEYVESKNWGQLFCGRCRMREDSALQAFEQICDAIAERYSQNDREKMQLDPVSHEILCGIFPVLRNTIDGCLDLPPAGETSTRLDSLEAAVRMSVELRRMGPLFIVIDDSQWADQDSLNALDRLQTAVGEDGLGVITVSRSEQDPQRIAADETIVMGPIATIHTVNYLRATAKRWRIEISSQTIAALAESTEGNPFRIRELAEEFRPGGALAEYNDEHDAARFGQSASDELSHLWQRRFERLSDEAKHVLLYIVTAGGRVSTEQLSELTEWFDGIDAAVSELARQRLISDEATGGECISILHDRVADRLTEKLSEHDKRQANRDWASFLVRQDRPQTLAARIAGHWIAAGQPGRAVSYAILAAEDAERRLAHHEAGRWHAMVIDHVSGDEKTDRIRRAACCYDEADFPVEAAHYYRMLAEHVDPSEQARYQQIATVMLLRSGRYAIVRDQLAELSRAMGLPVPRPAWMMKLSIFAGAIVNRISGPSMLSTLIGQRQRNENPGDNGSQDGIGSGANACSLTRKRQQLELCLALVRPMSMFDTFYASVLILKAARLARIYGDPSQRINVAVGEAVFDCYEHGPKQSEANHRLLSLVPIVNQMNDHRATGDVWAGIAMSQGLACQWQHVSVPLATSVQAYQKLESSHVFEIAHDRWLDLIAHWNLGRWKGMCTISDEMFEEAVKRNDWFSQVVTAEGFGCTAWLVRDRVGDLQRIHDKNQELMDGDQLGCFQLFNEFTNVLLPIYQGDWDAAESAYQGLERLALRSELARVQMLRVLCRSLGCLVATHQFADQPTQSRSFMVRSRILELRRERGRYSPVLADLYEGLVERELAQQTGSQVAADHAIKLFTRVQRQASTYRWRPYQYAAADALAQMKTGQPLGLLCERMAAQGVVRPENLSRLYTVTPPDRDRARASR